MGQTARQPNPHHRYRCARGAVSKQVLVRFLRDHPSFLRSHDGGRDDSVGFRWVAFLPVRMATDFIMPRLPDPQPAVFFHGGSTPQLPQLPQQPQLATFAASQPYSSNNPQISPLSSSGNASPTSPKTYLTRQVRPLFMPAVLRPTEFPSKPAPTKPKSPDEDEEDVQDLRYNNSFISLSGFGALGRLSRRSTGDSAKCVNGNWNLGMFPEPKGAPTRQHWKPDFESSVCDHATCRRTFNYFTRRHHCRKCGNIFCDTHSAFEIPLDQDARYNPRGQLSRSCAHCYSQFKDWRSRANSQCSSSAASTDSQNTNRMTAASDSDTPTPTSPLPTTTGSSPVGLGVDCIPAAAAKRKPQEVAVSVPRDWNWSTF